MATISPVRVGIVDDHAPFRRSLRHILEREQDLCVVAEAENGLAAVLMAEIHEPNVILMDAKMPLMDGFQATSIITSAHPKTKIIIMSVLADEGTRIKASEVGAFNFFPKECDLEGLLAVIRDGYSRGSNGVALNKAVKYCRKMIWDLVAAIAQNPKQVVVTKVLEKPLSFEIRVSLIDYELVLSKLTAIKTLAAAFAGLVEAQGLLIHVTPVGDSTASQDKA